jgi:hypothetical protein
MSFTITFVSSWKTVGGTDGSVVWFVDGTSYGPFVGTAVPTPLTIQSNKPVSVTAFVDTVCNPAASVVVFPIADVSPKVFANGLFLSVAENGGGGVTVSLSGTSQCPKPASSSTDWPMWATIMIIVLIFIAVIIGLILAVVNVSLNYHKVQHLKMQMKGTIPFQRVDTDLSPGR